MRSLCVVLVISILLLISATEARKNKKKVRRVRQCAKKPCRPSTNKPICASNGKIYANDCRFKIAQCRKPSLRIVPQRKCQVVKPTVAKKKKTPVCGSDGKTYPSKKKFQKAKRKFHLRKIEIKIKHKGECGKPLKKSKKGRQCKNGKCRKGPICGNNGIRYKNFRLFRKDKRKKNMYKNLRKVPCPSPSPRT